MLRVDPIGALQLAKKQALAGLPDIFRCERASC
jgi:hypothetical protein